MTSAPWRFFTTPFSIGRGFTIAAALLWSTIAGSQTLAQDGELEALQSPDTRIRVSIRMPAPGAAQKPRWSATFRGNPVLKDCELGLQTTDAGELLAESRVVGQRRRSVDERIPVLFGKSANANDRFNECRVTVETAKRRRVDLIFRCYDDAIALR